MKQPIKHIYSICVGIFLLISFSSFIPAERTKGFSLTVDVNELRNSNGTVLFALYNREDAFPDEHYTKYLKKITGKIVNGSASVTFENLPAGKYAVNILHDEDNNGKMNDPEAEPRGIKMTFLFASDPEGRGIKPKN